MYGLNENNGHAGRCQTVFSQEHPGNWKSSGLTWPTGQVLRGSGLAVFHAEKALKSGGLPEGFYPWSMHVYCSKASSRTVLAAAATLAMKNWPWNKKEVFLASRFLS